MPYVWCGIEFNEGMLRENGASIAFWLLKEAIRESNLDY
jgi:hypothetical protein